MTLSGWKRGVAALTRRELRTPPDHGAPVFAVAIMVATCRLELGLFRRSRHVERPAKPAIKIWGAACVSQGPLYAAHGIRRAAE